MTHFPSSQPITRARGYRWVLSISAALSVLLTGCGQGGGESAAPETPTAASPSAEQPDTAALTRAARQRFSAMLDAHAAAFVAQAPEFATQLGLSEAVAGAGYASRLSSHSFAADQTARLANEANLQALNAIDRSALAPSAQATYDILQNAYETGAQRNLFNFGGAAHWGSRPPYRVTQLSGVHIGLPRLLQTQQPLGSAADVDAYLARLEAMARVFDEVGQMVRTDAETGVIPPAFALEGAARSIASFIAAAPADNPLVTTLTTKMATVDSLTSDVRDAYGLRAAEIVTDQVYPAYARLRTLLLDLKDLSADGAGIWRLGQQGEDFYQHALDSYGAEGKSGDEVHQLGLDEVARITAEMDAILTAQGLSDGSVTERYQALSVQPENLYPNTAAARADLLSDLNDQVDAIMLKAGDWFGTLPAQPVEVRRIPVYEQDSSAGGYYTGPSLDGSRPGIYWINLKNTADWPRFTLKTLTYHEAVPGHHFQISLQRAIDDLPLIRNMMFYSEFAEGWALYAEQVAAEMGMYEGDPLGNLGRLQSELFRAARLVVDSGLHAKRWSREEAIEYMVNVTGDTPAAVTREVERYAVWPGQATSYKLGMLKIVALRAEAEAALGADFSISAFHDEILLNGSMPLGVLDARINRWIAAQKGA
ncbi:MAG: DUF885 domain-containing protein [Pseudomonadota bacterium]